MEEPDDEPQDALKEAWISGLEMSPCPVAPVTLSTARRAEFCPLQVPTPLRGGFRAAVKAPLNALEEVMRRRGK